MKSQRINPGGAGIYSPAGLARSIRHQANTNADVCKFHASRGRTDASVVPKFALTRRHPDQFPKVLEMIALILDEIDHSRILARIVRGRSVPSSSLEWSHFVKTNRIKESRFMLSVLTITKTLKAVLSDDFDPDSPPIDALRTVSMFDTPSAPAKHPPDPSVIDEKGPDSTQPGAQSIPAKPFASIKVARKRKAHTTTMNRDHMDDAAVKMLMGNCRELLFSVIFTPAHSMIEPELAGLVHKFDRNKVAEESLASLHDNGCIIQNAVSLLKRHPRVDSPRVHAFLSRIETNTDVANGRPHLWKRKNQSMFQFQELLIKHFKHCKQCGAERTSKQQVNILVEHIDFNQRQWLEREVHTEKVGIHDFDFDSTVLKLMAHESRQKDLEEWGDERPSEHVGGNQRPNHERAHYAERSDSKIDRPAQLHGMRNGHSGRSHAGHTARNPHHKTPQELLMEAKSAVKSPDHFHVFKFMMETQRKHPDKRDFFNKWVWKLLTSFERFKKEGCNACASPMVPHILCPGCHPALCGKPNDQAIIEHLKRKGHNPGGSKRRPNDRDSRGPARGHRARANMAVSFEPTEMCFNTMARGDLTALNTLRCQHHPFCDNAPLNLEDAFCEECDPEHDQTTLPCLGCMRTDPDFNTLTAFPVPNITLPVLPEFFSQLRHHGGLIHMVDFSQAFHQASINAEHTPVTLGLTMDTVDPTVEPHAERTSADVDLSINFPTPGGVSLVFRWPNQEGDHKDGHDVSMDPNNHPAFAVGLMDPSPHFKHHTLWVLDSGASAIMTNDPTIISLKHPSNAKVGGSNRNGNLMRVTHTGKFGVFPKVLLVPLLTQNLMSVSVLKRLGFNVDFNALRVSRGPIVWDIVHDLAQNLFFLKLPRDPQKAFSALGAVSFMSWNLAEICHRRFNHVSKRALQHICKTHNIKIPRRHFHKMRLCSGCALCKAINHPVPSKVPKRPIPRPFGDASTKHDKNLAAPFAHISIDTCGPITPRSHHGSNFFHVFVCKHTGFIHAACTRLKSDVAQCFIDFHRSHVENRGFKTKIVRTDGALELTRSKLQRFLVLKGIRTEVTPPFSSFANAHAERAIRTVTEGVRTLLTDAGVATKFWSYAVATFTHVFNRVPRLRKRAPLHIITGNKPKIDHIRIFGSRCHVFVHPQERLKSDRFQPTARVGTSLGCVSGSKSFWVLIGNSIFSRRSVNFDEDIESMSLKVKAKHHPPSQSAPSAITIVPVEGAQKHQGLQPVEPSLSNNDGTPQSSSVKDNGLEPHVSHVGAAPTKETSLDAGAPSLDVGASSKGDISPSLSQSSFQPSVNPLTDAPKPPTRVSSRSNKGVTPLIMGTHDGSLHTTDATTTEDLDSISTTIPWKPIEHLGLNSWAHACQEHAFTSAKALDFKTPTTHREAVNGPQAPEWIASINRELKSLREKGVWKIVKATKQKPIGMKWVFKVKQDENGHVTKFKSRLVCQGFRQRHGIDFFDTYAPVANYASIRVLLALAARLDLEIHQMDVDVAFLNGILKETVFCKPPPGVTVPPGHVLLLLRALYGTKQAARVWWQNIDNTFLTKLDLHKSPADPCVYFRTVSDSNPTSLFLVLFVDDILIFSNRKKTVELAKSTLKKTCSMTDQGELRWCLGMRVLRDRSKRIITLDQQRCVLDVLGRFGMSECKPVATPLVHNVKLTAKDCPTTPEEIKELESYHQLFRSIVGSCSYAALSTRPDIATATVMCAKFSHNPGKTHLVAAKRILRCLAGTTDHCIMFGGESFMRIDEKVLLSKHDPRSLDNKTCDLVAFSDSDWAGDIDKRRSTSGFIFCINGGPVSWKSKMQKCIAQSSAEAEHIAASLCAKETTWLRSLLSTVMGSPLKTPTLINVDNNAAIAIVKNPVCSSKTKHIEMRFHLVRDMFERGIIHIDHVPTECNIADILTKGLPKVTFSRLRDIMLSPQPIEEPQKDT